MDLKYKMVDGSLYVTEGTSLNFDLTAPRSTKNKIDGWS